ncbi:fatty-acyl-CoA synthase [Rhizobiales bacterium GAS191]|nr:fatty-acyl-CoA synthase [Rhizobiales bacterium GAS191]
MMAGLTLADFVARNAGFAPHKVALRCDGAALTYAGFSARIESLARALSRRFQLGRGDRIAHLGLNSPELLVLLYACARLGAMLVPMNWRLAVPELAFMIGDAEPKLLAIESRFLGHLQALRAAAPAMGVIGLDDEAAGGVSIEALLAEAPRQPLLTEASFADPLLLVYTSGTTGRPKGALLTQEALHWNAVASAHMHGLSAADHVLTVLPMFHVGGLNIQTTPALQMGATVTLHPRFAPGAMLAAIATERPSLTVLVPATLRAILEHKDFADTDLSSLRAVTTGSTIVPEALVEALAERGVRLIQVYGATETGPVSVYERFDLPRDRRDTTGLPGLSVEMRILDDAGHELGAGLPGEIALRGPGLFSGYWRNEEATQAAFRDNWFLSGDIGMVDADGYLYVRDRKKNVIISGGENIYPAEIERVILEFPGVSECAVIGVPDPRWQETPVALIVPRQGAVLALDRLEAHLAANLARFKLPRRILLRDTLPRNAMGKVQHFALKAELSEVPATG